MSAYNSWYLGIKINGVRRSRKGISEINLTSHGHKGKDKNDHSVVISFLGGGGGALDIRD